MNAGSRRIFRAICAIAVFAVLSVGWAARARAQRLSLPVERYRLKSGLQVTLAPDSSLAEVTVAVRYDVGWADDPPGKEGLAHLAEHLMFAGSRHVNPDEYVGRIEGAGGFDVNGMTGIDSTTCVETTSPGSLPLVFWLESDLALDLAAAIMADPRGKLQQDLLAMGAGVSLNAWEESWQLVSRFVISALVSDSGRAEQVIRAIDEAISDLGQPVSSEAYSRARAKWLDTVTMRLETSRGRAGHLTQPRGPGGPGGPTPRIPGGSTATTVSIRPRSQRPFARTSSPTTALWWSFTTTRAWAPRSCNRSRSDCREASPGPHVDRPLPRRGAPPHAIRRILGRNDGHLMHRPIGRTDCGGASRAHRVA